jgi:ABC-2 type transport system permease protein
MPTALSASLNPGAPRAAQAVSCVTASLIIAGLPVALTCAPGGVTDASAQAAVLAAAVLAGSIPFAATGFLIALLIAPSAAPAIINLIYLPLSFASGFWMPVRELPHWLQVLAPALPTYHLSQLALSVFGLAPSSGGPLHWAVLGRFAVLMLAAAWITFCRKEATA